LLVHCGKSIPGGGRAEPDRSRGWTVILGEGRRVQIAQAALRPVAVVLLTLVPDDHPGFGRGVELLPVQALIPEASVEAFHEAVLPWSVPLGTRPSASEADPQAKKA
jgi:hypothetical protein